MNLSAMTAGLRHLRFALPLAGMIFAAPAFAGEALSIYKVRGLNTKTLDRIADEHVIFDRHGENTFSVYVKAKDRKAFLALAPNAKLIDEDYNRTTERMCRDYKSLEQVYKILDDLAAKHPEVATVGSLGRSKNGIDVKYIKVSDNPTMDESDTEPMLVIDAATHGDECVTTETLMYHIEEIITKGASDPEMKGMVDNAEIYFVPIVSPDSHRRSRNVHGFDPNRSYPGPTGNPKGRVPSIDSLIKFFDDNTPDGAMSWHGATGNGMILHPYGHQKGPVSKDKVHVRVYDKIVKNMKAKQPRFDAGSIIDTIYRAHNSSIDYYWMPNKPDVAKQYQTYAVAIEVRGSKRPRIDAVKKDYVPQTRDLTRAFIKSFTDKN